MAVFENRSGAYFVYVSSGSAENRHLQAAMATFGSGSQAPAPGIPYLVKNTTVITAPMAMIRARMWVGFMRRATLAPK